MQLAGLTAVTASDAIARTGDGGGGEGDMYSPAAEHLFKEAARQYWLKRDWDSEIYCSPYETDIIYGFYDPEYIARVNEIGDGNRLYRGESYYCKTWFNKSYKESRRNACVTFIHEFGHLMGREHNTNLNSPMYNGYAYYRGNYARKLFVRWHKNVVGRTLCNAADLKRN